MSASAVIWLLLFAFQLVMSFRRPVWAIGLYMQTFFAAPHMWWWGDEIPQARYALWAGIVLLGAVLIGRLQSDTSYTDAEAASNDVGHVKLVRYMAIAMALNATFVHYVLAERPDISIDDYTELLKYVLLYFVMSAAMRDRKDFRLALTAIALGAMYIGYEVTINERGEFSGSRLEGVGAPAAQTANSLADLMLITLPLVGSLFLTPSWIAKGTALFAAPLVLNVLLLCNSRGAFLGLAGGAASFLFVSRGATRKRALKTLALGGIALFFLLGDPRILERFATTFVGSDDRDASASSRLDFWRAGMLMLRDYPLGQGGGAFKMVHGVRYLGEATGNLDAEARSLHQGYLTEATDWGIQGLILKLVFLGAALYSAFRTTEGARKEGRVEDSLIGISVIVSGAALLIHCFFGSFLGNEWAYWIAAILVRYSVLYSRQAPATATENLPKAA